MFLNRIINETFKKV